MARRQLRFPVLVRARVSPVEDALQLLVGPGVEVDRLDTTNMGAHSAMDTRAADADEDTQVPARPSWI